MEYPTTYFIRLGARFHIRSGIRDDDYPNDPHSSLCQLTRSFLCVASVNSTAVIPSKPDVATSKKAYGYDLFRRDRISGGLF